MKKPLQLKQVLAALLTIAALASGLTAQATVQTGIMMQGLARTVNNQTMCTFVIQSDWGGDQIPAQTGSSYTFSNARMIHGTVDVTLNGTLNFQVGTAFTDVITGNSFTVTIESSSLWFYGATVQTKNGTNVSGCSTTVSSNKHTLTVTIPSGKTFGAVILDYVSNPPMTNSNTTVTVPQGDYWVSNSSHKPKPEPTVVSGQTTLVKDTDYTLSWSNNSSAGTGTVTVTGIGNYAGSATGTFPIRWARYYVHFDKNHDDATGTMSDQQFTYNTAQALTANTFSRTGYSFDGWSTTSNGAVTYTDGQSVNNLTAEDGQTITLYAQWTPITYNITYDLAGGSVTTANPTTYNIETVTFTLNNPTRNGYTFAGWTGTDLNGPTMNVTIAQGSIGDRSYTATWNIITYNLTYDLAGGSITSANPETYNIETATFTLNNPTREGYTFAGWTGTDLNGPTMSVSIAQGSIGDRSYTATWNTITYNITYDLAGGSVATANPTTYNIETATFTLNNPTRDGYTFAGWTGTDLDEPAMNVTVAQGSIGDRSYTATWNTITYTITYDLTGGTVATANPTTYNIETATFTLNNPTRDGYTFAGWTGTDLNGPTMTVTIAQGSIGDRSYTATWRQQIAYIDADGNQQTCSSYTVIESSNSSVQFGTNGQDGWYVVSGNVTITGQLWLKGTNNHLILCDGASLTISHAMQNADGFYVPNNLYIYGQSAGSGTATITITSPGANGINTYGSITINGGIISATSDTYGIKTDSGNLTINRGSVTAHGNYYGIWSNQSIIINGGTVNATTGGGNGYYGIRVSQDITLGYTELTDRITASSYKANSGTISVKAGQAFYDGIAAVYSGTLTNTQISAIAGKTLQPAFTLTYDLAGGSVATANPTFYTYESPDITLNNPTREGYTFAGWTGTGLTEPTMNVTIAHGSTGHRSYTATWSIDAYTITYDLAGGSVATANPTTYTINSPDITLNNPTREGYTFAGWTGTDLTEATEYVTIAQGSTGDRSYTATWNVITYNITYDLAGGSVATANPTFYTYESPTFTLHNPTREGYEFAGWTGTGLNTPTQNVTITQGSTGHRSYTATWNIITYNITYDLAGGSVATANPTTYTITTPSFTLNNPTREGYVFAGWTGTGLTEATSNVTIAQGSTGNRSYTAIWLLPVPYIDANGQTAYCQNYTILNGSTNYSSYGEDGVEAWYVVDHDVTYTGNVSFYGSANLILVDGATLTLNPGNSGSGITMSTSNNFNIYVQSAGNGAITATDANIGADDNLTIYGGHISLTSVAFDACYLYSYDDLTINGGQITIQSNANCIWSLDGKLTINGGTLNAVTTEENSSSGYSVVDCIFNGEVVINGGNITLTNNGDGNGITADNVTINGGNVSIHIKNTSSRDGINVGGTITLGWTNASDRIMSEGRYYADLVTIATGKAFTDGTNYYLGDLTDEEVWNLAGKTLRPFTNFDETFHITYVTNGGTLPDGYPTTYTFGETVVLPVPTKEDNTFAGWFENSFFYSDPVTEITAGTSLGDLTLYALWKPEKTWVDYLDADGQQQRVYATVLYGIETELPGGVYTIVDDGVSFDKLSFTGTTTIILPDNKYLYVECMGKGTNDDEYSLFVNGDLTIYGQEHGDGVFDSYNVQVSGDVAIYGGTHVIGQLSANNGSGTITLSWTGWESYIRVTVYLGNVVLAKAFIDDDDNIHEAGTVADVTTINGQFLYPFITETEVSYLDENGVLQTVTATVLYGGEEAEYPGGVYTVLDMVIRGQAYYDRLHFTGDATIIIPDWCSFGVAAAKEDNEYWLHVDGDLTIYGQEYGNGECIFSNVTVNGHVNVYGGEVVLYNISANAINLSWTSIQNEHMVNPTQGTTVNLLKDFMYYDDDHNRHVINAQQGVDIATIATYYLKPYAETIDVSYIDENGDTHTENATMLFGDETNLDGGTYTIMNGISFSHAVSFSGDTKLIVPDGTYFYGYYQGGGINLNVNGDLAIYGQENRSGTVLYINASVSGAVTVSNVTVIYSFINSESDILIAGGEQNYGQLSTNGTITLGYLTFDDQIYCKDYEGTVAIRAGQTMIDYGTQKTYTGTLTADEVTAIKERYLEPYYTSINLDVAGYGESTESDHWVFIASPIVGSIPTDAVNHLIGGMTSSGQYNYDLYRFNQSASMEWENYHQHNTFNDPFLLENGKGYLYANKENVTLEFNGAVYPAASKEVVLDYDANAHLAGWNLVGNPFNAPAILDKSYYKMNPEGTGLVAEAVSGNTTIDAFTGVMVQAEGEDETVRFTKSNAKGQQETGFGTLQIALTQAGNRGNALLDNAIVSFNEGDQLGKFYFGTQDANIYIPQGNKEYAIVSVGNTGEMPINFKANENGTYTLTVNPMNVEMGYLHLIDNLTGANVDLLQTPEYVFTTHTTDYESRFKLVFSASANANGDNEAFAFIDASGNIIIMDGPSTGSGTYTLQVIDVMGRVMVSVGGHTRCVSTAGMTKGVYVLRLIDGNTIRTQKIVID